MKPSNGSQSRSDRSSVLCSAREIRAAKFKPKVVRIVAAAGQLSRLAAGAKKHARKAHGFTIMRCECGHAKSIHARMYANRKLGTACNFPECRCKSYRPS